MPYRLRKGIFAHPFEVTASVSTLLSVFTAFKILVYHPEVLQRAEYGILTVPRGLVWAWIVMGTVGSCLTISGLWMSVFSPKAHAIEAAGLWLVAAMWLSAGVSAIVLDFHAWLEYLRYFVLASGCVIRLLMLSQYQAIVTRAPREVWDQ